jgi:RNA polymerase sigma-70 factor (ECF subfamily)
VSRRNGGRTSDYCGVIDSNDLTADAAVVLIALYDAHVGRVYSYLLRRCGDRSTAEELTSETFTSALDSLRRNRPAMADAPWLIGIARHKLVDHWRRRERHDRNLQVAPAAVQDEPEWAVELDATRANDVLHHLPEHYRLALVLRYFDELPVGRIAEVLDRSVHGTESLLARARRAFKEAYEDASGGRHAR